MSMHTSDTNAIPNKYYRNPIFILLIAMGLVAVALCIFCFAINLTRPYMGAELAFQNEKWVVIEVDPSGYAATKNIEPGYEVISVNAQTTAEFPQEYIDTGVIRPRLINQLTVYSGDNEISLSTENAAVSDSTRNEAITIFIVSTAFLIIGFFVFSRKLLRRASVLIYLSTIVTAILLSAIVTAERNIAIIDKLQNITFIR